MKRTLLLIALLFLVGNSFAALTWYELSAFAVFISAAFLGVIYMVGMGFSIPELQMTSKEEMYQIVVVIVLLVAFGAITAGMDAISHSFGSDNVHALAKSKLSGDITLLQVYSNQIFKLEQVAVEGSKLYSCNLFGSTITSTSCGAYSALATPLTTAQTLISIGLVELNTVNVLLDFAPVALTLILPLGILLRTFKVTRPAGGLLLALGVTLYLILPMSIVIMEGVADDFALKSPEYNYVTGLSHDPFFKLTSPSCDPPSDLSSEEGKAKTFLVAITDSMSIPMFIVLVKGTLFTIIYLFTMMASIRFLSLAGGAEVDLSGLSRLM